MAGKKENIKALFSNTRSRVIIVFTALILVIAVVIGFSRMFADTEIGSNESTITNAPGIDSIPGALNPTAQYAKLQEAQNVNQAKKALVSGGSAIPTIVRSQAFGNDTQPVGTQNGEGGGVGYTILAREDESGLRRSQWLDALKKGSCNIAIVKSVLQEGGQAADIRAVCSCQQMKDNGHPISELQRFCSCPELKTAGVNIVQMREAGFSVAQLRICGFNACEMKGAGASAQDMKDGGYSDGEMQGAGFPAHEIDRASGLPEGITNADVLKAGCSETALRQLRASGVSASAVRRISGCSAGQLKAAGYTAGELKKAGFSAADLKNAGFTPKELKDAGYSARDLLNAGFSPAELEQAGFTPADISAAEAALPPGVTAELVKNAGCDEAQLRKERAERVSAKVIRQHAGCSAKALLAAGFTKGELENAGFTPDELKALGTLPADVIRAANDCSAAFLKAAHDSGVSAETIRQTHGCSAAAMKAAGYTAAQLKAAGFTAAELKNAGFDPSELKAAGFTAKELKDAGFSTDALKNAGFTAGQLKDAGFSAGQLKAAGFNAAQLKAAGFGAEALKEAGFSARDLKAAGFTAAELKKAGFGANDLRAAGFSPRELKDAGFNAAELRSAGVTAGQLRDAGFSAADVRDAGFSPQELLNAGIPGSSQANLAANENAVVGQSNLPGSPNLQNAAAAIQAENQRRLDDIQERQSQRLVEQRFQQNIQQRTAEMMAVANSSTQTWERVATQVYMASSKPEPDEKDAVMAAPGGGTMAAAGSPVQPGMAPNQPALIKTGDILFAVLDTSVNSDEPGPILATIVSGRLKGAKLIGSFTLPTNSSKMVISFNTMSVPGAAKSIGISAFAVDANTARTALATHANHHYFMRYGGLFASSFLEGFGNAIQSADTVVSVGGTGGGGTVTVAQGINRSTLQNALIGLATLGKTWGQAAQQLFNTPTTVELYSGTGMGILFTQDLISIT